HRVPSIHTDDCVRAGVPEEDRVVPVRRGDVAAVGAERHAGAARCVRVDEGLDRPAGRRVEEADGGPPSHDDGELAAVRAERQVYVAQVVIAEATQLAAGRHIPDLDLWPGE